MSFDWKREDRAIVVFTILMMTLIISAIVYAYFSDFYEYELFKKTTAQLEQQGVFESDSKKFKCFERDGHYFVLNKETNEFFVISNVEWTKMEDYWEK